MPLAGKTSDKDTALQKTIDTKNQVVQDNERKELSGKVAEAFERDAGTAVTLADADDIIEAREPDPPSMRPVEVTAGPVTAALTCPFLLKRPMHSIPFIWK